MQIRELWSEADEQRLNALRWATSARDVAGCFLLIEEATPGQDRRVRAALEAWAAETVVLCQAGITPADALVRVLWRHQRLRPAGTRGPGLLELVSDQIAAPNALRAAWFCVARLAGISVGIVAGAGASLVLVDKGRVERVNPVLGETVAAEEEDESAPLGDNAHFEPLLVGTMLDRRRAAQSAGELERAYVLARMLVGAFPESPEGWVALSEVAWEAGDHEGAASAIATLRERFAGNTLAAVASRRFKQRRQKPDSVH